MMKRYDDLTAEPEIAVNVQRIQEEFAELTSIDSLSFEERRMANRLKDRLKGLGFDVFEDSAGDYYGGTAGNVYGYLKGTLPAGAQSGRGILLSAHMDTVKPGKGKKAVFSEDGTITSGKDTVLGADDVAGIVEILEGIRCIQEAGLPHRDVEVLFPIAEEVYIKGTERFDFSRIRAKEAYVLDLSGPIGTAAIQAPTLISFSVTVKGKAAHAGFNPEDGIHAIQIMCRAIDRMVQGHVDEETTLNIGLINGGEATNIVPASCVCKGEIRSYSHEKALKVLNDVGEQFRQAAEEEHAEVSLERTIDLTAYQIKKDAPVVEHFKKACESLGISWKLTSTFGGSDNHNFVRRGIPGIVLSCGMYEAHSVREYTKIKDLEQGAQLVAKLIRIQE